MNEQRTPDDAERLFLDLLAADSHPAGTPEAVRDRLERARACLGKLNRARPSEPAPPPPDGVVEAALEMIAREIALRRAAGEPIHLEEYTQRLPHLAEAIRERFGNKDATNRPTSTLDAAAAQPHDGTAAPRPMPQLPGYEVLRELGRGGMGVVYLARQVRLNRLVALKMIQEDRLGDDGQRQRFRQEAELIGRLSHPHIVQVHEFGEHHGLHYFALEYVAGPTLAEGLAGQPLSADVAAGLVETLARAIDTAHRVGVVHRDLKPANILLQQLATDEHRSTRMKEPNNPAAACRVHPCSSVANSLVKITDFGLAKRLDVETDQTHTGTLVGTPPYMAPEQARGDRAAIGPRTDVYALGVILYECLTGRVPFKGHAPWDTLQQVLHDEPVSPSRLVRHVPRDLQTICLKCLHKEPRQRYASALALAEDLRRFRAGEPIQARPVSAPARLLKWARRRPAVAGLLVLVCLLAVSGFVLVTWQWRRAEHNALTAQLTNVRMALHTGLMLCEQGEAGRGLLWLARGLEHLRSLGGEEAAELDRVLRANLAGWQRQVHVLDSILPHEGFILTAAFSPDGRVVVTAGQGPLRLWDLAGERSLELTLPASIGIIHAAAFGPDGKTIVTGSADGAARVWEVEGPLLALREDRLDTVAAQPVGLPLVHRGIVHAVAISPDGKTLATGSEDGTARLWDVATRQPLGSPLAHEDLVQGVAFSPDGKMLATASKDRTARLWNVSTRQPLGPLLTSTDEPSQVMAVAFSPDGKLLATAHIDGGTRLWGPMPGRPGVYQTVGPRMVHTAGSARVVVFRPDGKTLVTAGGGHMARLWEVPGGTAVGAPLPHQQSPRAAAFAPDGRTVITAGFDGTARLWRLTDHEPGDLPHNGGVYCAAYSPDGRTIAVGCADHTVYLWDADSHKPLRPPLRDQGPVRSVAFGPDGKVLLTGSELGKGRLWRLAEGRLWGDQGGDDPVSSQFLDQPAFVRAAAFSPDGRTVITAGSDKAPATEGTARLWRTGELLDVVLRHQGQIRTAAFSPDGRTILTGADDNTARLWEAATGQPAGPPLDHPDRVLAAAFSPDGRTLLTGCNDGIGRLWRAATGEPFSLRLQHRRQVAAVAFSPDGRVAATGSRDHTAQLWSARSGRPLGPPFRHAAPVEAVAFSPDGRTFLTAGSGKGVRLWPLVPDVAGDSRHVALWAQVITGMELDDNDTIAVLDEAAWRERRRQLERLSERGRSLGGPVASPSRAGRKKGQGRKKGKKEKGTFKSILSLRASGRRPEATVSDLFLP